MRFRDYRLKDGRRIHIRDDGDGGVAVLEASNVLYLNRTALFFLIEYLEERSEEEVVKDTRRRFRKVRDEEVRKHYREFLRKIERFLHGYADPVTDLGFETVPLAIKSVKSPLRMDLLLTYRCNNKCTHCYTSSPRDSVRELKTEDWKRILDRLHDTVGVPNVTFTGGEPTMRDDLKELIAHAERKGIVCGMVTNGRRLSYEKYASSLVKAGLDYVQVTLESHRKKIHDGVTGVEGSWEETVQGIRNLVREGIYVDVNATLLKDNVSDVEGLVEFAAELGARGFSLNRLIRSGRGEEVEEPNFDEIKRAILLAHELSIEHDLNFTWYGVTRYCELNPEELGVGPKFCSACSINMAIDPEGSVLPCQSYFKPLGKILRDRWKDIWNHKLCREIREGFKVKKECLECQLFHVCRGGCPLEAESR